MYKLIEPKLTPGSHSARNRAQYSMEHGYVNGLGLPIAVVDRTGHSIIIEPMRSQGYTGKLVISIYHQTASGCQLNALSSIQDNPKLAKAWGETEGLKNSFLFAYEVLYEQLATKGWCYIDELDIIISTNWSSQGQIRHPRFSIDSRVRLGERRKRAALDLWMIGNAGWEQGYLKVGSEVVRVPVVDDAEIPALHMGVGEYKLDKRNVVVEGRVEVFKMMSLNATSAGDVDTTTTATERAYTDLAKGSIAYLKTILTKSEGVTSQLGTYTSDIDRSLDRLERVNKNEYDEWSHRSKLTADNLKLVSPVTKLLTDIIG